MSTPDRLTDDGQANDCPHLSASGVDTAPIGPEKVWRCDHCGLSWVDQGHGRAARLAAQPSPLPDPADGCSCTPHSQDAGGGYTEHLLESGLERVTSLANGNATAARARGDAEEERRWLDLLALVERLPAAQPREPDPCANCSGADDPHPPAWECSGCGAHVDVMPTKAAAQPPPTDRVDEATTAHTTVRWEVVRGSSTTGHQDKDRARADYEHRARTLHRGETISLRRITTRERREQRTDVIAERTKPADASPEGSA